MNEQKSISELWEDFKMATSPKLVLPDDVLIQMDHARRVKISRAELLERCSESVDCSNGHFAISHKLILRISHGEVLAFHESSAIFAFWAWDLERRQKEQNAGEQDL